MERPQKIHFVVHGDIEIHGRRVVGPLLGRAALPLQGFILGRENPLFKREFGIRGILAKELLVPYVQLPRHFC